MQEQTIYPTVQKAAKSNKDRKAFDDAIKNKIVGKVILPEERIYDINKWAKND